MTKLPTRLEFTDRFVRGVKVDARTLFSDESWRPDLKRKRRGLLLMVEPSGTKTWYIRKREDGKRVMRSIGEFPELGVAGARERFDDVEDHPGSLSEAVQSVLGLDQPKVDQLTVRRLVNRYIEQEAEPFNRDWKNQERTLNTELVARHGDLPADQLTAEHVLGIVQAALDRGSPRVAQEALKQIKSLYNWAMGRKRVRRREVAKADAKTATHRTAILDIARNPAEGIVAPTYKARSYHMEGKTLEGFQSVLRESTLREDIKQILLLQMMTFCRVGEVAGASWSEFDLRNKVWTIPAERYKTGREHIVMLPKQAVKLLKTLPRHESGYLFPQPRAPRPIASDVVGKEINKRRKDLKVHKDFSSHALRHSGLTWLAANHCPHEVRERLLGHVVDSSGDMSQRYQHHEFMTERREWTQQWADHIEGKQS